MQIDMQEIKPLEKGRNTPFIYNGALFKIETLPKWDNSLIREWRDTRGKKEFYDTGIEPVASRMAALCGSPTPVVQRMEISLVDGENEHKTHAAVRPWLPGHVFKSFDTYSELFIRHPKVFHRIDMIRIYIVDVLLGNWDRKAANILYDAFNDVFVPIDWDKSFSFDIVKSDPESFYHLLKDALINTTSGLLTTDPKMLGKVVDGVLIMLNKSIDVVNKVNEEIFSRAVVLKKSFNDFVIKYNVGNVPEGTANQIGSFMQTLALPSK